MQITLKQRDIEIALKMYLAAQGIAVANRSFEVEYTAARKPAGLVAEINIGEDPEIEQLLTELETKAATQAAPAPIPVTVSVTPVFTPEAAVPIAAPAVTVVPAALEAGPVEEDILPVDLVEEEPAVDLTSLKPPSVFEAPAPQAEPAPAATPFAPVKSVSLFA